MTLNELSLMHIVVALRQEAKPLINHFGLQKWKEETPYPVFYKDNLHLIISGVGRVNSAAACAYLHCLTGSQKQGAWLNVGLAGHRDLEVGALRRVDQIRDQATGKSYYPQSVGEALGEGASLVTVDHPETNYPEEVLYDMEGSGFFATVNRFSSAEMIGLYKVVSDNRQSPPSRDLDVAALMKPHLETLAEVIKQYESLALEQEKLLKEPELFQELLGQCHFTVSEQRQLKDLLRRWQVLRPQGSLEGILDQASDSQQILQILRKSLQDIPVVFFK